MLQKIKLQLSLLLTLAGAALAHTGQEDYHGTGMMWSDSSWMHNGAHMTGYNMWGMGWFGLLFGLAFWMLIILGIIYLYQQVTGGDSNE